MVGHLYFFIHLWMCDGGKLVDDLQVLVKVTKGCVVELLAIIDDDHSRQLELIDNGFLDEIASFLLSDSS